MRDRTQPLKSTNRPLISAVTLLIMLLVSDRADAQQSFLFFDWLTAFQPQWVDRFFEDDASGEGVRLAELPDLFGDTFARGGDLKVNQDFLIANSTSVLLAGGTRGLKPSEHNKAIPDNRAYFAYNHFHNAVSTRIEDPVGTVAVVDQSAVEQYLIGLESRFGNGLWSVELRMPFSGQHDFTYPGVPSAENHSGEIGNLSVLLKRLVYYNPNTSVVVGLGVETPTGSDFLSRTGIIDVRVSNDAVHLVPYLGVLHSPDDRWFFHGFVEVDVASNGNRITFVDTMGPGSGGKYNDQTLLYVDVSAGRWLHRNQHAQWLTGVAALAEVHYTTTLQDADTVAGALAPGVSAFTLTNLASRMDVVNLTAALHFEMANDTSLRVGGVVPITSGSDRFFDAEVAAQLIRRF